MGVYGKCRSLMECSVDIRGWHSNLWGFMGSVGEV